MTHQEIADKIKKLSSADGVDLTALEKQMIKDIIDSINESVVVTGGKITGLSKSAGKIVKESINKFYNSKAYKNSIAKILKDIGVFGDEKLNVYKDADLNIAKKNITDAQKLVIDEYLDSLNEDGLNAKFNQTMRSLIYENVKSNASLGELTKSINEKILSGKEPSEFGKYVTNATRQAASAYTNTIDQEILNKYKTRVTHFLVVGSLIDSSSPQCRRAIEQFDRKVPIDEMKKIIKFAKDGHGGAEDLTIDNLPSKTLHPFCRHEFLPYIEIKK